MERVITTGEQNFSYLREHNYFYIDKTNFIKEWWLGGDRATLITRPRRFGKTLMLDTVKTFFSPEFAGRSDLFAGLEIWQDEELRKLQGTIPVIFLSFARINDDKYSDIIYRIKANLASIYGSFSSLIDVNAIPQSEKELFTSVHVSMSDAVAQDSLHYLCKFVTIQRKIKPIILLDEYDTPLHAAWMNKYWDQLVNFMRGFFNATFKDNPWIDRCLISGITQVAQESIFSDLNNLEVATITSELYTDCFGFTESEVFAAMDEYGLNAKEKVKQWYDGYIFGEQREIYNPWSIIKYLKRGKFDNYWANTSSNALVGELIAHGNIQIKKDIEILLQGQSIFTKLDEHIVFSQLYKNNQTVWSLLLAAGYVKPISYIQEKDLYEIILTNLEAKITIETKIAEWFSDVSMNQNEFNIALLNNNLDDMNESMTNIVENVFSYFDTGKNQAENFYHAFILGLIINMKDRYTIRSNRQSGLGRYDICMFPKHQDDKGIVIEFKVNKNKQEKDLQATCTNALQQIKEKKYINELLSHNVKRNNIYIYGFAFNKQEVLICGGLEANINLSNTK
ncbi:MAG: AAA family ATPase [Desulfovibrionaceae bacterium]|nr:AAA family ATPase [Desulfovibrionaceae bacterium]